MLEPADHNPQRRQIDRKHLMDVRTLDLDHDPFLARPGAVDLPQRGGGQRVVLERGEELPDRRPQFGLDHLSHGDRRFRSDLILQTRQLGRDGLGQNVDAGGEELPHLDPHAAQARRQAAVAVSDAAVARPRRAHRDPPQPDRPQTDFPQNDVERYPDKERHHAHVSPAEVSWSSLVYG